MVQQKVFVHVGSPKTGTTYLQGILWRNRRRLARNGVVLPMRSLADHFAGTFQVGGWTQKRPTPPRFVDAWDRLVESALAGGGHALISHELYCRASEEQAQKALAPLVAAGRDVHVVITARDLARQIPAAWQERVKVGGQITFDAFSRLLRAPGDPSPRIAGFWRAQDTASLAQRWGSDLPPENVHIVTVPPRGAAPEVLWHRFAQALGIDPDGYDLGRVANESMRAEQIELARRVNVALDGRVHWPHPWGSVVKAFYQSTLAGRPGTTLTLTEADLALARQRSEEIVRTLAEARVDVIGSLDDLRVPADIEPTAADGHPAVDGDVVADEAVAAIAALLAAQADQRLAAEASVAAGAAAPRGLYRRARHEAGRVARRLGLRRR